MVTNGERLLQVHQTHWASKFDFEVYSPYEEALICDDLTHALNIQVCNSLSVCGSQCASEPLVQQLWQTLWSSWLSVPKSVGTFTHTHCTSATSYKHVVYSIHTSIGRTPIDLPETSQTPMQTWQNTTSVEMLFTANQTSDSTLLRANVL